jgi:hypothetical protein
MLATEAKSTCFPETRLSERHCCLETRGWLLSGKRVHNTFCPLLKLIRWNRENKLMYHCAESTICIITLKPLSHRGDQQYAWTENYISITIVNFWKVLSRVCWKTDLGFPKLLAALCNMCYQAARRNKGNRVEMKYGWHIPNIVALELCLEVVLPKFWGVDWIWCKWLAEPRLTSWIFVLSHLVDSACLIPFLPSLFLPFFFPPFFLSSRRRVFRHIDFKGPVTYTYGAWANLMMSLFQGIYLPRGR